MLAALKSTTCKQPEISPAQYEALVKATARRTFRSSIWEKVDYVPHAKQLESIHNPIDRGAKRIGTVAGRRGGKSEAWSTEVLTELGFGPPGHLPQRLSLIAAPESDITDNIFGLVWKAVVDNKVLGVTPKYSSVHERRIEMPWKSKAYGKTTKDPTSLRGPGLVLTIADEYAFGADIVAQYLIPPLLDCDGILGTATTPNGRNHAYKLFEDWRKQALTDPRYAAGHWTTYDNTYLTRELIEEIAEFYRRTGSWDIFRQEFLAEFMTLQGAIYPQFDETVHVQAFEPWPDAPVNLGIDWGFVHPFVCLLIQVLDGDRLFVLDEVYHKGLTDAEKLAKVREKLAEYSLPAGIAYCDPAAPQAIKTFREGGIRVFDPKDAPGKGNINSVTEGIAVVRGQLERRDPLGIVIHPRCKELIRTLPEYKFAEKSVNETPVKEDDDPCDALRYPCMALVGLPQLDHRIYVL